MSTTTTAYVDLTDAPMLDYTSDTDFAMHPSDSSPGWLTVEATMSDDTILSAAPTSQDYPDAIEVDMEPHVEDEEIPEYDMAGDDTDALHHYPIVDTEFVDVAEATDTSIPVSTSPATLLTSVSDAPAELSLDVAPHTAETSAVDEAALEPPPATATQELSAAVVDPVQDFPEVHAQSYYAPPVDEPLSDAPVASEDVGTAEVTVEAPAAPSDSAPADSTEVAETQTIPQDAHAGEVLTNGAHGVQEGGEAVAPYEDYVAQHEEYPGQQHELYVESVFHEAEEEPAPREEHATTTHEEDPNEISEGVYIDPPSAVLLSLVTSEGQTEFTLFNQPHNSSGSQSPNEYASTSAAPDLALLLHQRPSLYYEPLSNVFDALRAEEVVYNVPEFADGELILDAYDLELKVAEVRVTCGFYAIDDDPDAANRITFTPVR